MDLKAEIQPEHSLGQVLLFKAIQAKKVVTWRYGKMKILEFRKMKKSTF